MIKKITVLIFAVCVAFNVAAEAQKKPAAKAFTTSGFYNGITIGAESGDPGGMSVFLTESDGQLYALVMTAAGDFFPPVLVEAKQSGKDMRTVEFTLPEPSNYDGNRKFTGIVSANNLIFAKGSEKMTLKRDCGNLYSNLALGSGGDYGGMEVFLYDMAGELYALVTVAEGVLARPVLVKTNVKRDKDLMVQNFTFTLPDDNGGRKLTGKFTKTGLTLTENGTASILKDKCYR